MCSYPQREGFCSSRDAHYLITKAYFPESNNINYWLKIRLALKFWESLILSCPRSMSCTWKRAMAINIAVTMTYYVVRIRLATLKWVNQQSRSPWYKDGEYTKNCVFIKVYLCLAEHYLHPVCSLFLYSCLRSSTGGMVELNYCGHTKINIDMSPPWIIRNQLHCQILCFSSKQTEYHCGLSTLITIAPGWMLHTYCKWSHCENNDGINNNSQEKRAWSGGSNGKAQSKCVTQ